jgi:hypothetical protein
MVDLGGFDTHAGQTDASDSTKGTHANLLSTLSEAIAAFQKDLEFLEISERVVGMTFSEFGRRISSNGGYGTDHGSSLPIILFGKNVQSGILGANPTISEMTTVADNLPMQYDFRSIYASVLSQWFCVSPDDLNTILLKNYQTLPILKSSDCTSSIHELNQMAGLKYIRCTPNPFMSKINIEYTTNGGHTQIDLYNSEGKIMATPLNSILPKGTYHLDLYTEHLAPGVYYCRLQNENLAQVATIVKIR